MALNEEPLVCASCGGARSPILPWVCEGCLLDAANHAGERLALTAAGADYEVLRDRRLLIDVGMPVHPAALADTDELEDAGQLALHRAYVLWLLADELAWVHTKWGATADILERLGFLANDDELDVAVARAVEAALNWRQMCEQMQDAAQHERALSGAFAAVARRQLLMRHTEQHDGESARARSADPTGPWWHLPDLPTCASDAKAAAEHHGGGFKDGCQPR
ncbi:hypothetical protein ACI789_17130 [Geodermatophilus sp. SYSU D00965]